MQRAFSNILVIKLRHIGDVLLTSPVFTSLRSRYPSARICALVNSGTESMLAGNPAIDQIFVYNRTIKELPFLSRLRRELELLITLRRERFDLVLNLTEGDRGALASFASGAGVRVGIDGGGKGVLAKNRMFTHLLPKPPPHLHTVEQNLRLLEPLGVPAIKAVLFPFSDEDAGVVRALIANQSNSQGEFFHAHVTSRWMFKTLPPAKTAYLLDKASELSGLKAILTAAPEKKELDYLRQVIQLMRKPCEDFGGKLTLKQLGALSSLARFFIGVDSAPMHMAAALDVPVLGIFGPSSATHWGPWDNSLDANPYTKLHGIQFSSRHMVLQSERPCYPCFKDGCNGSKVSDCLDFSLQELDNAARTFLDHVDCTVKR